MRGSSWELGQARWHEGEQVSFEAMGLACHPPSSARSSIPAEEGQARSAKPRFATHMRGAQAGAGRRGQHAARPVAAALTPRASAFWSSITSRVPAGVIHQHRTSGKSSKTRRALAMRCRRAACLRPLPAAPSPLRLVSIRLNHCNAGGSTIGGSTDGSRETGGHCGEAAAGRAARWRAAAAVPSGRAAVPSGQQRGGTRCYQFAAGRRGPGEACSPLRCRRAGTCAQTAAPPTRACHICCLSDMMLPAQCQDPPLSADTSGQVVWELQTR